MIKRIIKVKLKEIEYDFYDYINSNKLTINDIDNIFYSNSKYKNERSILVINKNKLQKKCF